MTKPLEVGDRVHTIWDVKDTGTVKRVAEFTQGIKCRVDWDHGATVGNWEWYMEDELELIT